LKHAKTISIRSTGVLHHVIIKYIERRKIFRADKDRDNFIERLEILLTKAHITCYAWALLSNHAYFLFKTAKTHEKGNRSRIKARVDARDLYCYWAARELRYPLAELARRLNIKAPGVVYAVRRGKNISKEPDYNLID
jgi:hypothetical protein